MIRLFLTAAAALFILAGCDDDTSKKGSYKSIPRDSAYAMIQHYLDTNAVMHDISSVIRVISFQAGSLKQLASGVDSVRLFTGASLATHQPVIIIQTIKRNSPPKYEYFQVDAGALCPPPYDCVGAFEVAE